MHYFSYLVVSGTTIFLLVIAVLLTPGFKHKGRARWAVKYVYDHLIHRHLS